MPGYARKVDANQREIVEALESIGAGVRTLQHEADGLPDLLVGWQGVNYLLEIKTEDGELTPAQVEFFLSWPGQKAIIRTAAEALRVLGIGFGPEPQRELTATQISHHLANPAQSTVVWSIDAWRKTYNPKRRQRR